MINPEFIIKIENLKKRNLTLEALQEILLQFDLHHPKFVGFAFRDELNPKGLLLTAEGTEETGITIKVPKNILDFDISLIANLLMHEMYHVYQRTGDNQIITREEREWQAYREMIFHEKFKNIPALDEFYIRQFAEKALTYYDRMSDLLQAKYAVEKIQIQKILNETHPIHQNLNDDVTNYNVFEKINIRVGTILEVNDFEESYTPAYQLTIDFGILGIKKSSAKITDVYKKEDLIGRQIMAIINLNSKEIETLKSECFVIGVLGNNQDIILLDPARKIENGTKIG